MTVSIETHTSNYFPLHQLAIFTLYVHRSLKTRQRSLTLRLRRLPTLVTYPHSPEQDPTHLHSPQNQLLPSPLLHHKTRPYLRYPWKQGKKFHSSSKPLSIPAHEDPSVASISVWFLDLNTTHVGRLNHRSSWHQIRDRRQYTRTTAHRPALHRFKSHS